MGAESVNGSIGDWDTSGVTYMGYMFRSETDFNEYIGTWDTRSVTDMYGMF